jgi:hypothetical protein
VALAEVQVNDEELLQERNHDVVVGTPRAPVDGKIKIESRRDIGHAVIATQTF